MYVICAREIRLELLLDDMQGCIIVVFAIPDEIAYSEQIKRSVSVRLPHGQK